MLSEYRERGRERERALMASFAHSHFLNPSTSTSQSACTCGSFVAGPFNNFQCRCAERRGVANMNTELKAKLKFLQSFEPGPMSDSFRGDLKLMGSDNIPVYAHRFIMVIELGKSCVFRILFFYDSVLCLKSTLFRPEKDPGKIDSQSV